MQKTKKKIGGLWIPYPILEFFKSHKISAKEVILCSLIFNFQRQGKGCFVTIRWFAEKLSVGEQQANIMLINLKKLKLIENSRKNGRSPCRRLQYELEEACRLSVHHKQSLWVPRNYIHEFFERRIDAKELLLLTVVRSYHQKEGCSLSNRQFADYLCLSYDTISSIISNLRRRGLLEIVRFNGRKRWLLSCV